MQKVEFTSILALVVKILLYGLLSTSKVWGLSKSVRSSVETRLTAYSYALPKALRLNQSPEPLRRLNTTCTEKAEGSAIKQGLVVNDYRTSILQVTWSFQHNILVATLLGSRFSGFRI